MTVESSFCPKYEDVASDFVLNDHSLINSYQGIWYEVASHNVEALTHGCACTRYNFTVTSQTERTFRDVFTCKKGHDRGTNGKVTILPNHGQWDPTHPGKMVESLGPFGSPPYWVIQVWPKKTITTIPNTTEASSFLSVEDGKDNNEKRENIIRGLLSEKQTLEASTNQELSYALVYACIPFFGEYIYFFARTKEIPVQQMQTMREYATAKHISLNNVKLIPMDGCVW